MQAGAGGGARTFDADLRKICEHVPPGVGVKVHPLLLPPVETTFWVASKRALVDVHKVHRSRRL